jgi:excisionase family DNA binding protein
MTTDATSSPLGITNSTLRLDSQNSRALLDCKQTASYLNISTSYVRKAVRRNAIPFVRIGTRTLFRVCDLDEWIANHLVATDAQTRERASRIAATVRVQSPGGSGR